MKSRLPAIALSVLAVLASGDAMADRGGREDRGERDDRRERDWTHDDDRRSLGDSVRRIERRTRGQVLSAERVPFDGRDMNRVKVVDASGRVRVYMDDPREDGERRRGGDDDDRTRDRDD